jgi:cyanophycin synthetase
MHDNPRYGEKPKDLDDFYNKLKQLEITDNEKY